MYKYFYIIALLIWHNEVYTQSYSNLIDHGFDNSHLVKDCFISNDTLVCVFNHICQNSNDCFTLNRFNLEDGKLIDFQLIDSTLIGNSRVLNFGQDEILISSHDPKNDFNKITIERLSKDFNRIETLTFLENDSIQFINEGILMHKGSFYLWGQGRNLNMNIPVGHVVKLNEDLTSVQNVWYYNKGTRLSPLSDLQVQPDCNLSFLIFSSGPVGPSEISDSLHLIKIDTTGQIINEVTIEEGLRNISKNFLTLKNGNYVIMNYIETIYGQIQCLDSSNSEVLWTWKFPEGLNNEFNKFIVRDYKELENGDIVFIGSIQEVLEGIWDKSSLTAFAVRLNKNGELIWLRRFLVPNKIDPNKNGPFHFGSLKRVYTRNDNTLLFVGESTQIVESSSNNQYAWVLSLDENDCYNENCNDTIIIQNQNINKHKFEIGAKWTYERKCIIPNRIDFYTYEIIDTLTIKKLSCYAFDNYDTMCVEGNKVFAYDSRLTDILQLLFDYDENFNIPFECFEPGYGVTDYNISIDSTVFETISDGQSISVSYVDTFCSYGWIGNINTKIYHGIGSDIIQPFPCSDFCNNLVDPVTCEVTKLRCFENSSENYRFVDYPCDTVWMTTNIIEVPEKEFSIYPNPTNNRIYIKDISQNIPYIISTIDGKFIKEGKYSSNGILWPNKGLYQITIIIDNKRYTKRFIRI